MRRRLVTKHEGCTVERAILDQAFLHIFVVVGAAENRNGNIWRQLMLARLSPAPNPVTLINRFTP
jgi:hypothetical protein